MNYPNLQALRRTNEKAANEMVVSIACGVHAGNENMVAKAAARTAVETAEEALKLIAEPDQSGTIGCFGRASGYLPTNDGGDS